MNVFDEAYNDVKWLIVLVVILRVCCGFVCDCDCHLSLSLSIPLPPRSFLQVQGR